MRVLQVKMLRLETGLQRQLSHSSFGGIYLELALDGVTLRLEYAAATIRIQMCSRNVLRSNTGNFWKTDFAVAKVILAGKCSWSRAFPRGLKCRPDPVGFAFTRFDAVGGFTWLRAQVQARRTAASAALAAHQPRHHLELTPHALR